MYNHDYMEKALSGDKSRNKLLSPIPHIGGPGDPKFDHISTLDIDKDSKDAVILWANRQERVEKAWATLDNLSRNPGLPKAEAEVANELANTALDKFSEINREIAKALEADGLAESILNIYIGFFDQTKDEKTIIESAENVGSANKLLDRIDLASAICTAIVETRANNPKLRQMRQKIAQSVFDEMCNQFSQDRLLFRHRIEAQPTAIIDSPIVEKSELTSALLSEDWTGKERKKAFASFNQVHDGMLAQRVDGTHIRDLNKLWRWADEGVPEDVSVFTILEVADRVYGEAGSAFQDVWEAQGERERERKSSK